MQRGHRSQAGRDGTCGAAYWRDVVLFDYPRPYAPGPRPAMMIQRYPRPPTYPARTLPSPTRGGTRPSWILGRGEVLRHLRSLFAGPRSLAQGQVAGGRRAGRTTEEPGGADARTVSGHLVRAEPVVQPAKRLRWPVLCLCATVAPIGAMRCGGREGDGHDLTRGPRHPGTGRSPRATTYHPRSP